jgi:predicted DCC family thiol-disulfide oxidoreductase YuxK
MNDTAPAPTDDHAVVLFDGVCNLCNGAVNFIIDRDPAGYFRFAPLQSDAAAPYLNGADDGAADLGTNVLVEGGQTYVRSTAALRVARRLTAPWPLLFLAIAVPRPLRDAVYNWVAHNRYDWFGKRNECRLPTPGLRDRFLDYDPP